MTKTKKKKRPNFSERIREIYGKRKADNFVQWYVKNR